MKFLLFFLCPFMFSQVAFSQSKITGKIADSVSNEPISYVNIGVVGTSLGAVSNEFGIFSIVIPDGIKEETVRFSAIGYGLKEYSIADFMVQNGKTIEMDKVVYGLGEISVKAEKMRQKRLGSRASSSRIVTGWGYRPMGSERGIRLKTGNKPIHIKSLHVHIATNEMDYVLMRVHIREMNEDIPGKSLLRDDILIPVELAEGWVELDLEPWDLVFDRDIAVTLQPVSTRGECKSQYCFTISAGMFRYFSSNWLLAKDGSEGKWFVKKNLSPGIYLTVYQ